MASNGLRVCARKRGGGKCEADSRPFSDKAHDKEPTSEDLEAGAVDEIDEDDE